MEILKTLRKRASLTLRQVEEATSISNAYLSQLENGKIKKPSAQALYVLSKLYCTNIEELLFAAGMIKDDDRVIPVQKMNPTLDQRVEDLEKKISAIEINHIVFGG